MPQHYVLVAALLAMALTASQATESIVQGGGAPTVQLRGGTVGGKLVTTPFGVAQVFKGVPYAAPPVGNLRFAAPQHRAAWNGTWNATEFAPGCMAICDFPKPSFMCPKTVSEDCLYLNVYAPANATPASNLPVIIFFHGGGFYEGSGGVPLYDGGTMAVTQNVIVVTTNYRLNVFGALFTGTIRGNFQMQDQRFSMQWVQDNIGAFGGNKRSVTISGQSAGAWSVGFHMVTPKSWPLFHRAITVSDPYGIRPLNPFLAMQLGAKVLQNVSCPMGGTPEIECLRALPAKALLAAAQKNLDPNPATLIAMVNQWMPVVDGDELPIQPISGFETGQYHRVPYMFGNTVNESIPFVYGLFKTPLKPKEYELFVLALFGEPLADEALRLYGKAPQDQQDDLRPFFSRMGTDYLFTCPNHYIARLVSSHIPTYVWEFGELSQANPWAYGAGNPCDDYVCHASDLPFIFDPFYTIPKGQGPYVSKSASHLMRVMQDAWGNFAYTSDPNPADKSFTFPRFHNVTGGRLFFNETGPFSNVPIDHYRKKYCELWDKVGYHRR